jgi:hypothetical protein
MAQDNDPGKLPPKIKLNGSNGHPSPVSKSPKSETTRIDLAGARIPSADEIKKSTTRIAPAPGMTQMSEEDREEAMKKATVRIETVADMMPYSEEDRGEATKKSTVKIDSAAHMAPLPPEDREEAVKRSTIRIEPTSAGYTPPTRPQDLAASGRRAPGRTDTSQIEPFSEEDKLEAAKKSTVRVQVDEDRAKGDTTRLDTAMAGRDASKKRTTRINLNEVLEEEQDIFKRRTALLDASKFASTTEAPGIPRTIRIKRSDAPPTTALRAQPPVEAAPTPLTAADLETSKKSETARIDLPPEVEGEQPPTRRKTIRIKRPSGGPAGGRPLIITRAAGAGEAAEQRGAEEPEAKGGSLFAGVALVAVLIAAVLIYVLAAQTIAPNMPFPGRL